MEVALRKDEQGTYIPLRVTPKAGKNAVTGAKNGLLLVAVRAAPADGEANAAVIETLQSLLGCARSDVALVRGLKSREKTVLIRGMSADQVEEVLIKWKKG